MVAKRQKGSQMSGDQRVCCLSNMNIFVGFPIISFNIGDDVLGYAMPKSFLKFLQRIDLSIKEKKELAILCRNLRTNNIITVYLEDLPDSVKNELLNII